MPTVTAEYQREWRTLNPERHRAIRQRSLAKNRTLMRAAKDKPCTDCAIRHPFYIMQFDHVRGDKKFDIAQGLRVGQRVLLAEIAKCDVVCANCHAERTYRRLAQRPER